MTKRPELTARPRSMMWRILVAAPAAGFAPDLVAGHAENLSPKGESTIASERGVEASVVYDGEGLVNATGGIRTGVVYVGTLHLQLTVDGERLLGWRGMTFFLRSE